jgi:hypothetical protein
VVGDFFDGDVFFPLFPDNHYFIFLLYAGNMGDVHDGDIHAHAAEDGSAVPADEDVAAIAKASVKPVIVADGEYGDFGGVFRGKRTVAAHARACGERLDRSDFGFKCQGRLESDAAFEADSFGRFARIVA